MVRGCGGGGAEGGCIHGCSPDDFLQHNVIYLVVMLRNAASQPGCIRINWRAYLTIQSSGHHIIRFWFSNPKVNFMNMRFPTSFLGNSNSPLELEIIKWFPPLSPSLPRKFPQSTLFERSYLLLFPNMHLVNCHNQDKCRQIFNKGIHICFRYIMHPAQC